MGTLNFRIGIFLLFFLLGCDVSYNNNIYTKISLGSSIEIGILKSASQIIYDEELVLVYNLSEDLYRYSPHLLFYNENRKFYAANYFSSERIESIKNGIINAYVNEERVNRRLNYINDLPAQYSLNYLSRKGTSKRISDKIVNRISLGSSLHRVSFDVDRSVDLYEGLGKSVAFRDSIFFQKYTIAEKHIFNISELVFDYKNRVITYYYYDSKNTLIKDNMIVKNSSVLDSFYIEILKRIKKGDLPQK